MNNAEKNTLAILGHRLLDVAALFLRLGVTGFGGPAAHLDRDLRCASARAGRARE